MVITIDSNFITRKSQQSQECKTHASNAYVACDLDLWSLDLNTNALPWLIVDHYCVKFDDPGCIVFWGVVGKTGRLADRQTDRETPAKTLTTRLSLAWVIRRTYYSISSSSSGSLVMLIITTNSNPIIKFAFYCRINGLSICTSSVWKIGFQCHSFGECYERVTNDDKLKTFAHRAYGDLIHKL